MVVMGWYWRRGRVKGWEAEAGSMRNVSPSNGVGDSARSVLEYVLGVQSYTPFETTRSVVTRERMLMQSVAFNGTVPVIVQWLYRG